MLVPATDRYLHEVSCSPGNSSRMAALSGFYIRSEGVSAIMNLTVEPHAAQPQPQMQVQLLFSAERTPLCPQ